MFWVLFSLLTTALASEEIFFERGHFSLTLPDGWESVDSPAFDYDYTLSAILLKTSPPSNQIIREQIGVTTEYTYSTSPEKFFKHVYRDTLMVPGVTVLDQGIAPLAGRQIYWFTYRWERPGDTVLAKISLVHTPLASHRFIFLAPEDTFTSHLTDVDAIVASFRPGE